MEFLPSLILWLFMSDTVKAICTTDSATFLIENRKPNMKSVNPERQFLRYMTVDTDLKSVDLAKRTDDTNQQWSWSGCEDIQDRLVNRATGQALNYNGTGLDIVDVTMSSTWTYDPTYGELKNTESGKWAIMKRYQNPSFLSLRSVHRFHPDCPSIPWDNELWNLLPLTSAVTPYTDLCLINASFTLATSPSTATPASITTATPTSTGTEQQSPTFSRNCKITALC